MSRENFINRAAFHNPEGPKLKPAEERCLLTQGAAQTLNAIKGSDALLEAQRRLSRAAVPRDVPARAPTTFEAQLAAIRAGARLVERFRPPARGYDRTLGGVSEI